MRSAVNGGRPTSSNCKLVRKSNGWSQNQPKPDDGKDTGKSRIPIVEIESMTYRIQTAQNLLFPPTINFQTVQETDLQRNSLVRACTFRRANFSLLFPTESSLLAKHRQPSCCCCCCCLKNRLLTPCYLQHHNMFAAIVMNTAAALVNAAVVAGGHLPLTACTMGFAWMAAVAGADHGNLPFLVVQTYVAMIWFDHAILRRRQILLEAYSSLAWLFIRTSLSVVPLVTYGAGYGTYHPLLTPLLAVAFWKTSVAVAAPIMYVHTKAGEASRKVKTAVSCGMAALYNAMHTAFDMLAVAVLSWAAAHIVIIWLVAATHGGDAAAGPVTLYGHELAEVTIQACQWLVCGFGGCLVGTIVVSRPLTSLLFVMSCPFWLLALPKMLVPVAAYVAWSQCSKMARILCGIVERIANVVGAAVNPVCDAVERVVNAVGAVGQRVWAVADVVRTVLEWALISLLLAVVLASLSVGLAANP
jgi:hypothetical protein